jgi:hypothetical protein
MIFVLNTERALIERIERVKAPINELFIKNWHSPILL